MFINVCIFVYVCVYLRVNVCVNGCVEVCVDVCVNVCVNVHEFACVYVWYNILKKRNVHPDFVDDFTELI